MVVSPHPHTGLQTVSWLFSGEIEHRDSAGHHAMVRPGEVNLMTAGRGISRSEYSTSETTLLHGAQLWLALPDSDRHTDPAFEHYAPKPILAGNWEARVFLGSLLDSVSPVRTYTPLLGAELRLKAGTTLLIPVREDFEHGVLLDSGAITVNDEALAANELGYVEPGHDHLMLRASEDALLLLLGGPPFGEQIVMWWNFIGRDHDEIVGVRDQWQGLINDGAQDRFTLPPGDLLPPIPAPPLPNVRMVRRG